jgi:hypothetical protein
VEERGAGLRGARELLEDGLLEALEELLPLGEQPREGGFDGSLGTVRPRVVTPGEPPEGVHARRAQRRVDRTLQREHQPDGGVAQVRVPDVRVEPEAVRCDLSRVLQPLANVPL